jgi:hypothetical protein
MELNHLYLFVVVVVVVVVAVVVVKMVVNCPNLEMLILLIEFDYWGCFRQKNQILEVYLFDIFKVKFLKINQVD